MVSAAKEIGYPLTPLQEGLLFNAASAPGSGVDVVQIVCAVGAALDAGSLEKAWGSLLATHGLLRTCYRQGEAVEAHPGSVGAYVTAADWRGAPRGSRQEKIARHLEEERRKGFALDRPPLVRLSLIREEEASSTLVLTLHHILLDGWSYPLLLEDLLSVYEAIAAGGEAPSLLRGDFRSYARWLGSVDHRASGAFWRAYLGGIQEPTPLPHEAESAGPAGPFMQYGRVERRIPSTVLERLRALSEASGVRFTTIFHAAWGLLLARYAGREEAVFGETRACRRAPVDGIAGMLGCFINTVPVRVRARPEADVWEWLAALEREHTPVRDHERTPLGAIREWIGAPGDRPLFDSIIVYNTRSARTVMRSRRGALHVAGCSVFSHTNFPLVLEVSGEEGELSLTFARDRFSAGTVARVADNLVNILCALPEEGTVADIPAMTPAEERMVLREFNDTRTPSPPAPCVHALVAEQAARTPAAVAVRCGADHLSYGELEAKSAALARRLAALGARPGTVVGIALERSCSLLAGLLGVLRSGAAYLPLDLSLPGERLAFMTHDAACGLILTTGAIAPRLKGCTGVIVDIDGGSREEEAQPRPAGPDDAAYIMYTSGSTGKPKGTVVLHRGLANYVTWAAAEYPFREGSGSLVHTSIAFDLTVTGLYPPLLCGREVHLLPDSAEPGDLAAALLARPGYSVVKITPAHLDLLTALIPPGEIRGLARALVIGGSPLRGESLMRWRDESPETALYNEYGPTETVVGCSVYRLPDGPTGGGPVPIGRPIANTRLYIVDPGLRPVPVGAPGELCIAGEGVAAGYLNRPELSAAKFVPDAISGDPGGRLYRSGDIARYRPDGTIEYIGRADGQIKVRGYRVETGEIETVLLGHGSLREAAVLARADASGDYRLEAYCVPAQGGAVDAEALRAHARRFLPVWMVPALFVPLAALPLTGRGKVDMRALAALVPAGTGPRRSAALSGTEESLAAVWKDLLGAGDAAAGDNFFERGGHSLLVMRLIARIHALWNVEVRISEVFAHPTLAAMAALIDARVPEDPERTPGGQFPGDVHTTKETRNA